MSKSQLPISNYIFVLRIAVTAGLLAAGVIFGTLSFITLSSYEDEAAVTRFDNLADYAFDTIKHDLSEKESTILAAAKNMGYSKNNITEWPNVLVPGFYDSGYAQRDASSLGSIFFTPIVPPENLASFEKFMFDYYLTEPRIGPRGGLTGVGRIGVYTLGLDGKVYNDKTGVVYLYNSSRALIVPIAQFLFTSHVSPTSLLFNMHSVPDFGHAIDAIIECSKRHNYTMASQMCANMTNFVIRPIGATGDAVKYITSAIMQPIYHERNTSRLLGFMCGGFDWVDSLAPIFRTAPPGVDIVLKNNDVTLTYYAGDTDIVVRKGFGDLHDRSHDSQRRAFAINANEDGTENYSTYTIMLYPTDTYFAYFSTNVPVYAAIASSLLLALCAATFFLYDYYMRKATEANEAVLETKRRFVRFISHEIRTPLNAVHLGLEALTAELRRMIDDPVGDQSPSKLRNTLVGWLELSFEMMANSESAVDVLNDLLNYDKIEMGTLYLDFSSVPIFDVVQACMFAFLNQVKQKNVHMVLENGLAEQNDGDREVDVEQQDFSQYVVIGDAARLAQVMRNLISNALKFTPENGRIAIEVKQETSGISALALNVPAESLHLLEQPRAGSIHISVTDSGVGLTVEQLAQICSEGVQFNANELQAGKGSGLGLFITKGIVEQHGGKLSIRSAGAGTGTTFTIELPLFFSTRAHVSPHSFSTKHQIYPEHLPPCVVQPAALHGAPTKDVSHSSKRILVVDDVLFNRKILMRILISKGYVCEQAEDGQQAIDVYRASLAAGNAFDAITMDFEMPVMNGPTATAKLRELGCTVPIIGVTGNLLPDDINYFKSQGATEVMGKPLNMDLLESMILQNSKK